MALTGDALLADALFRHLNTLTTVPATSIAWPGVSDNGQTPRLEVQFVPNTKQASTIDAGEDSPGFLVVTVVTSEGRGTIEALNIASQVSSHFGETIHTSEHRVRFVQPPSTAQPIPDGAEIRVPVSIPYLATS